MNEVSVRVLPVIFAALKARGLSPRKLVEGLAFDETVVRNLRRRIDWNDFARFLNRVYDEIGNPEEMIDIGRTFVERPELRTLVPIFAIAVNPAMTMKLLTGWFGPSLFHNIRQSHSWVYPRQAELRLALPLGHLDCPAFFLINVGALSEGMRWCSPGPARVELEQQPFSAIYQIHFKEAQSLREKTLAQLKRIASRSYVSDQLIQQQNEIADTVAALRNSEEKYRLLIEQMIDGIWRFDIATERFEFSSQSTYALTGYTPEEVTSMPLSAHLFPEDKAYVEGLMRSLTSGERERIVVEVRHIRKDGRVFWGEIYAALIRDQSGKPVAIHGVTRDVTPRKEAEAERIRALVAEDAKAKLESEILERKRVEAELVAAKEQVEASLRLKASILANLSHEIRTPLTALIGFSQILRRRLQGTDYEPQLSIVQNAGQRLLLLLNNMLDLARLEAGKYAVTVEPYPLAETVVQVTELLGMQAKERGLKLAVDVPQDMWVLSDRKRDEQILLNVLGNAIRFTESGAISISASVNDATVVLRVRDTGIGIAAAFLPHVFEEFRQESEGIGRRHDGSGLGLALSKKLVEAVGGEIRIESTKHVGTLVEIILPAGRAHEVSPPDATSSEAPPMPSSRRARLLVVEDDFDCMAYLCDALSEYADVVRASTGEQAEAILRQTPRLDGAVFDINLKGSALDGFALFNMIRGMETYAKLPIMAMTAYALAGDKERVLTAGFNEYLAKPVDYEALQRWVLQLAEMQS